MYRIELSPGEETAFRSIEELAVAIRRKVVTSRARIYHNATGKWLPIQFHPHYKIAVSMPLTQADLVAGPPVAPLSSLRLGEVQSTPPSSSSREAAAQAALAAWPAPKPASTPPAKQVSPPPVPREPVAAQPPITLGTPAPEPRRVVQPPRAMQPPRVVQPARIAQPPRAEPSRVIEPARPAPARATGSRKGRKRGRPLRIALAGAVLAACAHLLVTAAASSPRSDIATLVRTPRRLIELPAEAMQEDSPRTVAGVLPALQTIPLTRKTTPSLNRAPSPAPSAAKPAAIQPKSRTDIFAAAIDSAAIPEIQPAPAAGDLSTSVPPVPVTSKLVDSTGKKAMKRILRTVSGSPAPESKTTKR